MQQIQYSSGDMVADRRAGHAAALAAERAFSEAAEVMEQALELVPQWVAGWSLLGGYREAAGDVAGAVKAWLELLRLDVAGVFGARLKLSAHGAIDGVGAEQAYVEALFDDYAPRFEQSLVDKLGYRVPELMKELVAEQLRRRGMTRCGRAIDLGCGTGLVGVQLRPLVEWLEGVDLSAKMVAQAGRKQIYDRLERGELVAYLDGLAEQADLIVAGDVFNYVGALDAPLAAVRRALADSGTAVFSLEVHEGDEAVRLDRSLRFKHGIRHVVGLCEELGLVPVTVEATVLRTDRGTPVDGALVVVEAC
ncbi:methyltransferase [Devosia sp. CN2-171]|uniref:class I SAM-dependent DNA methyltransferase n=1 Tax=Devosia sp. CN2-171 TaxID=3400909 RepID=UPI003BF8EB02